MQVLRLAAMAVVGLALAGCARESPLAPSYLGVGAADAATEDDDARPEGVAPTLRRIPSNKVLGAMAFQKVTGRPVDPSRLSGSR